MNLLSSSDCDIVGIYTHTCKNFANLTKYNVMETEDTSECAKGTTHEECQRIFQRVVEMECARRIMPLSRTYVNLLAEFLPIQPEGKVVPSVHWQHLMVTTRFPRLCHQSYVSGKGDFKKLETYIDSALYNFCASGDIPTGFTCYKEQMSAALLSAHKFFDYDLIAEDSPQTRVSQRKWKKKRVARDSESDASDASDDKSHKRGASQRKKRSRAPSPDDDDQDESTNSSKSKKPPRKKRRKHSPRVRSMDSDCGTSESETAAKKRSTRKRRKRTRSLDEDVDETPRKKRRTSRKKTSRDKKRTAAKAQLRTKDKQDIKVSIYYAAHALAYFMRVCETAEDWEKPPWLLRKVIVVGLSHCALVNLVAIDNQTAKTNRESAVFVDPAQCATWPKFLQRLSNRADKNTDEDRKHDIFDLNKHHNEHNLNSPIALDLDLQNKAASDPNFELPDLLPYLLVRVAWKCTAKDHAPPANMFMNLAGFGGKGTAQAREKMCCSESTMQRHRLVAHMLAHHASRMRSDVAKLLQSGDQDEIDHAIDDDVSLLADYLTDHAQELSFCNLCGNSSICGICGNLWNL